VIDSSHDARGSVLFTSWVAVVLMAVIPPVWIALALTRSREGAMRLVSGWARRVFVVCGCRLRVTGLEHLENEHCAIVVANHSSYLDSVVLLAVIATDYRFVANHLELLRPFVGLVLRKGRHLIVDRTSMESRVACTRAMLDALDHGTSLVLFPEGTRSGGHMQAFRNGAFRTSVKSGRPIVPVAISGTSRILPRHRRLLARSPIDVRVLPPIRPGTAAGEAILLRQRTIAAISDTLDGV
jgi:1-acyl-sn-glycerol-3-phosphate acyltransferase